VKILVDENIPAAEQYFGAIGELHYLPGRVISRQDLHDVDVLLVRSVTRVDRELLQHTPVRFVGSCTAGVDHIDRDYLQQSGIAFAHAPGANARSVVEYVLSALCHLSQQGRVDPGMSVAIVGVGNVGRRLYHLLDAIGFECMAYDPLIPAAPGFNWLTSFEQVLRADIISLHTPLTTSGPYATRHRFAAEQLAGLGRDAILINSSRGAVVDNQALLQLLPQRQDLAVVLDVWEPEPDIDLSLMSRVALATPHIAGYSYDGKLRGTKMVYRELCRYLDIELPPGLAEEPQAEPLLASSGWRALCDKMLSIYDIASDDRSMRECLLNTSSPGSDFERLRRDYPVRREAAYCDRP
jgi:erythronate-4-phosphate dehydrogenase